MRIWPFFLASWLVITTAVVAAQKAEVQVRIAPAETLLFLPTYSAPATTLSLNDSRIGVETPGRVLRIPVRVGDSLEKGQLLAELDCSTNLSLQRQAVAEVDSANARLALAKRQVQRTRALQKERNVSEEILNQRETDLLAARADIAARQAALDKADLEVMRCRVLAPFTGMVTERLAGEGEWVSPGQPLLRLLDSGRLEVSAQIPLSQIESLQQAKRFDLAVAGDRFSLRLRRLLPAIDSIARNREARLEFVNESALPGSSGRLLWQASDPHLPADIAVRRNGQLGVFLEEGGFARFLPLTDALEGHSAPADLPPGTKLILEGRHSLEDGDPVILVP